MVDELKAWEERQPQRGCIASLVALQVMQRRTSDGATRDIVLDQSFATASSFGRRDAIGCAGGCEGMIASEVAVGAQAVLALAVVMAARA